MVIREKVEIFSSEEYMSKGSTYFLSFIFVIGIAAAPLVSLAAPVPAAPHKLTNSNVNESLFSAKTFIVADSASGEILAEKNKDLVWNPASLTKLVSALVLMDTKPDLNKVVTMAPADEVGGSRLNAPKGVKYKCSDLIRASIISSANNATNALVRCAGLTKDEFVSRMNLKAESLGTKRTHFIEPTGISEVNVTTAEDFKLIADAAFEQPLIHKIATMQTYSFKSVGRPVATHNLRNTNHLLFDSTLVVNGGKTGYIDESGYNLALKVGKKDGKDMIVVVFGTKNSSAQFVESKKLANWAWQNYEWPKPNLNVALAK